MNSDDCIKMYKTFIQPYFLYAIEIWGHTVRSKLDILNKLQSKVLRILFNCKRSEDAWRHSEGKIINLHKLYSNVIRKLCMKHHCDKLPRQFSISIMPKFNVSQLGNKISRVSLDQMYNYQTQTITSTTGFQSSCIEHWNSLPMTIKSLPYTSSKEDLHKHLKILSNEPLV